MPVKSGKYVAQFIDGGDVDEEQIQPNGVDLTLGKLERVSGIPIVKNGDYSKGNRQELISNDKGAFSVNLGAFIVTYDEIIEIPEDCVGYVFPRSRVMRSGAFLSTALWDAGYRGKGEGMLMPMTNMRVHEDTRLAQIAFIDADEAEEVYDGSHQHENL